MSEIFPFLMDFLAQPQALQSAINGFDPGRISKISHRLAKAEFDRVIITGMGASLFGTYPAWLDLINSGIQAYWIDTSELLASASQLITPRSLLWMVSNSGRSTEITRMLKRLPDLGSPTVMATTNNPNSLLAQTANLVVPLNTDNDITLSTRTYIGTLAVTQLTALILAGKPVERELGDLRFTLEGLREYTNNWGSNLAELDQVVGHVQQLAICGRGSSYATALEGALLLKEGPKKFTEGLSTGQFWHGPIELADSTLTLLFMAGSPDTQEADELLAAKVSSLGTKVLWFSEKQSAYLPTILLPKHKGIGISIAEFIPLELIALNIGKQTGFPTCEFRYLRKVISTKEEISPE